MPKTNTHKDKKENLVNYWRISGLIRDEKLLKAFLEVPREKFVLSGHKDYSYEDLPLPILEGQTISQPTTVMIMTQALELKPGLKILEVGAGSGYQAALLSKLVGTKGEVITTEIVPELVELARKNLDNAGIKNVKVILHDGSQGYEAEAPYDRIIVTAACPRLPEKLIEQLAENGIIVAPVAADSSGSGSGSFSFTQEMLVVKKVAGKLETHSLGYFTFVPMKGEYGFR